MRKIIVLSLVLLTLCCAGCMEKGATEALPTPEPTPAPLYFTEDDSLGQMQLLRVDGVLYYNSNLRTEALYGYPDATIASSRYPGNVPDKDNQSNFGAGYEYYIGEQGLVVCIDGTWWQFHALTAEPIWGLQMDISNVTTKGADITVTRYESDVTEAITMGTDISLEKWTPQGWTQVEGLMHIMDMDWGSHRWTLHTGDSEICSVDWSEYYGALSAGSYRLSKQFRYYASNGVEHVGNVCVQFDVTPDTPEEADQYNRWGIKMTAEQVTPEGLHLTITRSDDSDWEITTGEGYTLSVLDRGNWLPYAFDEGSVINFGWNSIGYLVTDNAPVTMDVDWTRLYGTLPVGEYRLTKFFSANQISDRDPPHEEIRIYAEFKIEE